MSRRTLIGVAVAALIAIALFCLLSHPSEIQAQLHDRASQALAAAGLAPEALSFDGRDATLAGSEQSRPVLERAQRIVAAIPGVRTVKIVTTPAVSAPAPPVTKALAEAPPEPAPVAAAPVPARVVPLEESLTGLLAGRTIDFETSGAVLDAQSRLLLAELSQLLQRHPEAVIRVEGHTDSRGDDRANRALSQARADAVVDELESLGVSSARLRPIGFGETRPVASNDTAAGRRLNRRVEIRVHEGN